MELFINDLSIHQQFANAKSFLAAFEQIMAMRKVAEKLNLKVYRHQSFLQTMVTSDISIQQAINEFPVDKMRAARSWLMNRAGPFWDANRQHGPDDYLEYKGEIVTDTAVGEAAYRHLQDYVRCDLLSFISDNWNIPLVRVVWHQSGGANSDVQYVDVKNWWHYDGLEKEFQQESYADIKSWLGLQNELHRRCVNLKFSDKCFDPLESVSFERGLLDMLLRYFEVLNQYVGTFTKGGKRTSVGDRLYQDYFTGDKAWFSNSSKDEMSRFKSKMTFPHPEHGGDFFCPWHGKPRGGRDPIRFHFSEPTSANEPVYIVYVGPKLTKR